MKLSYAIYVVKYRIRNLIRDWPRLSFSYAGEDMFLLHFIRNFPNIQSISWLDIGSSFPVVGNNFFLLSRSLRKLGINKGVCISVDPRPGLRFRYRLIRPNEIFIKAIVGNAATDFYENLLDPGISSRNRNWAEGVGGGKDSRYLDLVKKLQVDSISVSELQREYVDLFSTPENKIFSILSIDVEGGQEDVLNSIDFEFSRPDIILIELLTPLWGEGVKSFQILNSSSDPCYVKLVEKGYTYVGGNTMTQYFLWNTHLDRE